MSSLMLPLIGRGWTPAELNSILQNHVVRNRAGGALTTFGCVECESELYRGVMRARCYPWNMPKHRFHKMNPQVIPSYPWLYTYITGYPGISLANDAAPASPTGPTRLAWRTLLICPWRTHGTRALSCSSSAFCALKTEGPPRIPAGRMAPMTLKHVLCFSALLRSSSCRPQGP